MQLGGWAVRCLDPPMDDTDQTLALLELANQGDADALDSLFLRHRDRLARMVRLRLDQHVKARIDASDVLQETHLEAWSRLESYMQDPQRMPFFLWLRFLTGQKVLELHRRHLGAQRRDARQEVQIQRALPDVTNASLAFELVGNQTAPSLAAARAEQRASLEEALDEMDAVDRSVLTLRHFEQLSNAEAAAELGMKESAASKRYVRALRKLKQILEDQA